MQNFDPALETRVLKTLLDRKSGTLLTTLNKDWFGMPVSQEIWGRIETLKNNGKAIPTTETLSTDPVLSEKAQTILKGVGLNYFEEGEIENALDQLDRLRKGRLIFKMLSTVTDICKSNDADLPKAQLEIEKCLSLLQTPDHETELLSYGIDNDKALALYEETMDTSLNDIMIPTGYSVIDSQQGGLSRGRVYTIGAASGGGKSTLCNNIAINMYKKANRSIGYYSFEMNREECLLRTQANITRIPSDRYQMRKLSPEERKKSDKVFAQFLAHGEKHGCRLDYHCPSQDINIAQVFNQAEHYNYDVIMIDYINLMAPLDPKKAMWENIGEAFRLAKRWAEKVQKVVIMLVQIDEDTGAIKYAKSIKHHSDGVWQWDWGEAEKETGQVEIQQKKLRNMAPMKFTLQAEFEFCSFTEGPVVGGPTSFAKPMNL